MRTTLYRWASTNRVILTNASSLVSTTAVASALGFVYWWLAARQFPHAAVGLASAAISAMMLLGNASVLGLGTLLIGELPRQPGKASSLITTALVVAGAAGGVLGLLFAIAAPALSADLRPLAASFGSSALFALGVSLTAVTLVLDQALIGLLRGELQLWRNTLFAITKLVVLWAVGVWAANTFGLTIYATWVVGSLISLVALVLFAALKGVRISAYWPEWTLLRRLGKAALEHHALNLALQSPSLALPVLVTAQLSATTNAYFYTAWMVANFVFIVPLSLTTVLYAISAAEPGALARKIHHTLGLSAVVGLLANVVLLVGADLLLKLFGPAYAEQASSSLRILVIGVFPLIIRNHYIAISRIRGRVTNAALVMAVGGFLELTLAAVGAGVGGLTGLSVGWLAAVCIEAVFMARTVYRTATSARASDWNSAIEATMSPQ